MKKTWIIILTLVVVLVAGAMYHNSVVSSHESEVVGWQNKYAQSVDSMTTLVAGKDTALVQMAQRVDKIRVDNDAVKQSLKESKASLRYWASMAASYQVELEEYKNISTEDSTVVTPEGDSLAVRTFGVRLGLVHVAGNFDKLSPWDIRFTEAGMDSIDLKIGIAENRDGTWNTYIADAPQGFKVNSMNAVVSPYRAPWYTKIHVTGDVMVGSPFGLGAGVGYGPWTGKIYGTSGGASYGLQYTFYPFKEKR